MLMMRLVGEDGLGSVEQAVTELKQERDQLKVCCERLRIAALNAVSMMPGGGTKAALRDAYDETPEQSLAAHDSKVIERFCDYAQTKYHFGLHSVAKDYANQLRQQAKEVQS